MTIFVNLETIIDWGVFFFFFTLVLVLQIRAQIRDLRRREKGERPELDYGEHQ